VAKKSGARYAMAEDIELEVREDGEWYLNWPPPDRRQLRGPDLDSLQLWIARVYEQLRADAGKAKVP
jgi:hypothetical protein